MDSLSDCSGESHGENVDALASITLSENDDYQRETPFFGEPSLMMLWHLMMPWSNRQLQGASSNISLIQQISSQLSLKETSYALPATQASDDQLLARTRFDSVQASMRTPESNANSEDDPYAMPPVAVVNHLIHIYFSTVHLFQPVLDERSFIAKYKACQSARPQSFSSVGGAWLGTFYIVLSCACQCLEATSPNTSRAAECELYYRKAMKAGMKDAIYGMGFEVGRCPHLL